MSVKRYNGKHRKIQLKRIHFDGADIHSIRFPLTKWPRIISQMS